VSVTEPLASPEVERVEVTVATDEDPAVVVGTYQLGRGARDWSSRLHDLPANCYSVTARAYAAGGAEPLLVGPDARACVRAGATAVTRIVLGAGRIPEGLRGPVLDWTSASTTGPHPRERVVIDLGFTAPDADEVTLTGIDLRSGTRFAEPATVAVDAERRGRASIAWQAPAEPSDGAETLELALADGATDVRLRLSFRVPGGDAAGEPTFGVDLAPAITALSVGPADPYRPGTTIPDLGELPLGLLAVGFQATDPDACRRVECETPRYRWDIPASCGPGWSWVVPFAGGDLLAAVEGDFARDAGPYAGTHLLAFPLVPSAACELVLEVTDGEGAGTVRTVAVRPWESFSRYTPRLETSFQSGDGGAAGNVLDFGVIASVPADDIALPPLVDWNLAGASNGDGPVWIAGPVEEVQGSDEARTYASTFRWHITQHGVPCSFDGEGAFVPVTARVCNPFVPPGVPVQLCNRQDFRVDVESEHVAAVCNNLPAP
jgi:hypothetical protein